MVSDGVGRYHGRAELGLLSGGDRGDVSAYTVRSVVSKAGGCWVGRVGYAARWSTSPLAAAPRGHASPCA
jgi:hypothetical protein